MPNSVMLDSLHLYFVLLANDWYLYPSTVSIINTTERNKMARELSIIYLVHTIIVVA